MPKLLAVFVALFSLVSLAMGGPTAASDWSVDHTQSSLTFEADQAGSVVPGTFDTWDAEIAFDPDDLAATKFRVTVQTGSITSANTQAAQMLPGEGWFNAGAFPQAVFEATEVIDTGNGAYEAIGTLTIKDMAMPMVLPFTLTIDGDTATVSGSANVLRSDYAIGKDIPESTVASGVTVKFELVATR